ncbi:MAG: hypothetical protein U9N56_08560 [Actinomycetota bacterium]|nr:hypothetical protein [Actinomycetota bacterium]
MSEPTPRQVLYALVSAGFWLVTAMLTAGAAVSGLAPTWWTVTLSVSLLIGGVWMGLNWRKTGPVLLLAIGLFLVWMIGTLAVA